MNVLQTNEPFLKVDSKEAGDLWGKDEKPNFVLL